MERTLGEYRIIKELGRGSHGTVFLATPTRTVESAPEGEPVAIKVYRDEALRTAELRSRAEREFELGSTLRHPNLAKLFEYRAPTSSHSGFLVMQYVDGMPLDRWLRLFHPINGVLLGRLVGQLWRGLNALHSKGILHRDLKPSNVMLSSDFRIRIMDYGLACRKTAPHEKAAIPAFYGTVLHAAPETLEGAEATEESDYYSLGSIIYDLLHGAAAFATEGLGGSPESSTPPIGGDVAAILARKKSGAPACSPSVKGRSRLEERVADLCASLMAASPEARPSGAELAAAIEAIEEMIPASSELEPLHGYMATALTGLNGDAREAIVFTSRHISDVAKEFQLYVYEPRRQTDPLFHPDVPARSVYLLDRKRVVAADVLFVLANKPSFGVGQEIEIAASYGKPAVLVCKEGVELSRMVTGSFLNLVDDVIWYREPEDLAYKLRAVLSSKLQSMRAWKSHRVPFDRDQFGSSLRAVRMEAGYSSPSELAEAAGVSGGLLEAIESGDYHNVGMEVLRSVAAVLRTSVNRLVNGQGDDDAPVSDVRRTDASLQRLARLARGLEWSARDYLELEAEYLAQVAASGRSAVLSEDDWVERHRLLQDRRRKQATLF